MGLECITMKRRREFGRGALDDRCVLRSRWEGYEPATAVDKNRASGSALLVS